MYLVFRDLPTDPKDFHLNMDQSLGKARSSVLQVEEAVERMSRIQTVLAEAPANVRQFFSFRHFVPSTE